MFIQQGPAQTFNYMVMGFAVILGVMAAYIASFIIRARNMRRDLTVLEEIAEGQDR
jgi:hypothetical protein